MPLSPARKDLFFALDMLYCAQRTLGSLITLGNWQWWNPIPVVGLHAVVHCVVKYVTYAVVVSSSSKWSYAYFESSLKP